MNSRPNGRTWVASGNVPAGSCAHVASRAMASCGTRISGTSRRAIEPRTRSGAAGSQATSSAWIGSVEAACGSGKQSISPGEPGAGAETSSDQRRGSQRGRGTGSWRTRSRPRSRKRLAIHSSAHRSAGYPGRRTPWTKVSSIAVKISSSCGRSPSRSIDRCSIDRVLGSEEDAVPVAEGDCGDEARRKPRPRQLPGHQPLATRDDRGERYEGRGRHELAVSRPAARETRVLVAGTDRREEREAGEEEHVAEVAIHQEVRDAEQRGRGVEGMPRDAKQAARLDALLRRTHRARRRVRWKQPRYQEREGQRHHHMVQRRRDRRRSDRAPEERPVVLVAREDPYERDEP